MIDYEKIGVRIKEGRRFNVNVTQEKMAEDLGMYQADISNLEKAKKGSGITDLMKLDIIADYYGVPLETLIFGQGDMKLMKYYGKKMEIQQSQKKLKVKHRKKLANLMGKEENEDVKPIAYECGPYMIYSLIEKQYQMGKDTGIDEDGNVTNPEAALKKLHTYVFYESEVIASMVTDLTTVMNHVHQEALENLQMMIPRDILDVTDVIRTLNPYWALWRFAEEDPEKAELLTKLASRMDKLRQAGEDRSILYIESIYVREDYRRNGMFRMFIDYLKLLFKGCIIWLNMEPTTGAEMDQEYDYLPSYTVSELGQINMNASIAEKMGFTVDPDTWHREAEKLDADGNLVTEVVQIRKCAYFFPKEIQEIVKADGDLVALGRAKQRVEQSDEEEKGNLVIDLFNGIRNNYAILEMKQTNSGGIDKGKSIFCYAAKHLTKNKYRFGVSRKDVLKLGLDHKNQLEQYKYLDDASDSKYFEELNLLNMMLIQWADQ